MPGPPTVDDGDSTSGQPEQGQRPGDLKLVSHPITHTDAESRPPEAPPRDAVGSGADAPAEAEEGKRRGVPIWVFLLVVLGFAIALVWQVRVAGELEQQVAGLEQDLRATRADLGAHRSRLGEIRSGVRGLVSQLDGLRALVEADPSEAAPSPLEQSAAESTRPSIPNRLPAR